MRETDISAAPRVKAHGAAALATMTSVFELFPGWRKEQPRCAGESANPRVSGGGGAAAAAQQTSARRSPPAPELTAPPAGRGRHVCFSLVRLSCTDGEDRVNDLISACFRRNRKRAFPFLSTSSGSESSSSSVTLSLHPRSRRHSQISAVTSLRLWFRVLNIISVLV